MKHRIWLYIIMAAGLVLLTNRCTNEEEPIIIKDIVGNVYTSVTIGTQVWMVENLKTSRYNDGEFIPLVTDNDAWGNLETPGYCWYNNNTANKTPYGALYNWYAVSSGKLCPIGWHVPEDSEWNTLITFLGGEDVAGGKLKEMGFIHWTNPNEGATNETGFTALGSGLRDNYDGVFLGLGDLAYFWSISSTDACEIIGSVDETSYARDFNKCAFYFVVEGQNAFGTIYFREKGSGLSVRCIKD